MILKLDINVAFFTAKGNLFENRINDSAFEMSALSIPWAKSRIDRKCGSVWVGVVTEYEGWIDDSTCIRVHIPYLRCHTEIYEMKSFNFLDMSLRSWISPCCFCATKNHNVGSELDCLMISPNSGQITNTTPASIFVFSDYWCLIGRASYSTANYQDSIVCWYSIIAPNS